MLAAALLAAYLWSGVRGAPETATPTFCLYTAFATSGTWPGNPSCAMMTGWKPGQCRTIIRDGYGFGHTNLVGGQDTDALSLFWQFSPCSTDASVVSCNPSAHQPTMTSGIFSGKPVYADICYNDKTSKAAVHYVSPSIMTSTT